MAVTYATLVFDGNCAMPDPGRTATAVAVGLALIVVPVGLDRIWQGFTHVHGLPLTYRQRDP